MKSVCVFAASSMTLDDLYLDEAFALGRLLGQSNWRLVFGGGQHGLMGAVAKGLHDAGGHVLGIIPEVLNEPHIAYEPADEWIVTETLRERKALMDSNADAFIVLPGGLGTLEEMMEVVTLKQLDYHRRPIAILNSNGFYSPLLDFFSHMVEERFVKDEHLSLFHVVDTPQEVLAAIELGDAPAPISKY